MNKRAKALVTFCPHIVLAEDDKKIRGMLSWVLRREGYCVTECSDGMNLLDQLATFFLPCEAETEINLIISDDRMPGLTGMEILMGGHEKKGFPPMILFTARGDEDTRTDAAKFGAAAIFDKPFNVDKLIGKVREILTLSQGHPL